MSDDIYTAASGANDPSVILLDGTGFDTSALRAIRNRLGPMVMVVTLTCGPDLTSALEELAERRINFERRLIEDLPRPLPQEAYPLPFGWREPMLRAGLTCPRPARGRSSHAAARRDGRRRRRTRWIADLKKGIA